MIWGVFAHEGWNRYGGKTSLLGWMMKKCWYVGVFLKCICVCPIATVACIGISSTTYMRMGIGNGSTTYMIMGVGNGRTTYMRMGVGNGSTTYMRMGIGNGSTTYVRMGSGTNEELGLLVLGIGKLI